MTVPWCQMCMPTVCPCPATQSAQLLAQKQAEQADTSARLAALEEERAALQAKLAAEKARASQALTLEQLQQQHNERWWNAKQVRWASVPSHDHASLAPATQSCDEGPTRCCACV